MQLAIETSSLVSSVALLHGDTLRAELTIQARLTHSEQLMPHIADMLTKASVKKSQIDGVAVSIGPGSFTGLRIGLASAKALAFGWDVPLVGVETPTSLAWNCVGARDRICVLIDAQKKKRLCLSLRMAGDGIEDAERYTDTTAQRCPGRPQSGHEDDSLFRRWRTSGQTGYHIVQPSVPHGTADDGHSTGRQSGPCCKISI